MFQVIFKNPYKYKKSQGFKIYNKVLEIKKKKILNYWGKSCEKSKSDR